MLCMRNDLLSVNVELTIFDFRSRLRTPNCKRQLQSWHTTEIKP
ncbi:unnamed protein product [Schistosoma margrebowiei]|uniref:Uncharacterized protein n=1 Tax=Schistosoma margrebowiei TaxID=48269 RepID=A0A183LE52_9TREM|nr:unnamed protein product [Schistosoma margrebowiei]